MDFGFSEKKALEQNYKSNVEDELNEAYNATRSLEKDLRQLVSISECLVEKSAEYEETIREIKNERDEHKSDIGYLQDMYDQVKEREAQKNEKI